MVLEDVRDRVDRAADDAGGVQGRVDLGRVPLGRPLADDALDLVLVLSPRQVGRELRIGGQLGPPHRLAEPPEHLVRVRRDDDPLAVARLEDVRGRDALQIRPLRLADDLEPVVLRHHALEHREARLEQGDVDHLAPAEAERVALVESGQDALSREHTGERVAERDVHAGRRLVREAVDVADPAHRLRDRREACPLGIGAGLAVAGDAGEHEPRVHLAELLPAEVPALERPGAEVLGEDVGLLHELEQELLAPLGAQVQRDALLVSRLHGPPERAPLIARLAPLPDRVGLTGRLDLDDLGAHVAEQAAGERPGEKLPELDHADAGERPFAVGRASLGSDGSVRHAVSPPFLVCPARSRAMRTSRASRTCSFMTSSARSASRAARAAVSWRW